MAEKSEEQVVENPTQRMDLPLRRGDDITRSGFPLFARSLWFNLERRLFDELLWNILQGRYDETEHKKCLPIARDFEKALRLLIRSIAANYNLGPGVQMENAPVVWSSLVGYMQDDWEFLTKPMNELSDDEKNLSCSKKMDHAMHQHFYLDPVKHGIKVDTKWTNVLQNVLGTLKQKREQLEMHNERMRDKNDDLVWGMGFLPQQRLFNISKRTKEIEAIKQRTEELIKDCYNLAMSSSLLKGAGRFPYNAERIQRQVMDAIRDCKIATYRLIVRNKRRRSSNFAMTYLSQRYKNQKVHKKIEPGEHLEEARKLGEKVDTAEYPQHIREALDDADKVRDEILKISHQAREAADSFLIQTSCFSSSKKKRDSKKNRLAQKVSEQLDDVCQEIENLKGMIYLYMENPIDNFEKLK